MEEQKENNQGGGLMRNAVLFLCFFALAAGYYLFIDWVMMVFAQNLPFPYKG